MVGSSGKELKGAKPARAIKRGFCRGRFSVDEFGRGGLEKSHRAKFPGKLVTLRQIELL
jgi:hypothetical protein